MNAKLVLTLVNNAKVELPCETKVENKDAALIEVATGLVQSPFFLTPQGLVFTSQIVLMQLVFDKPSLVKSEEKKSNVLTFPNKAIIPTKDAEFSA